MQVEIETKPKVYEPKTLKITFETEEEFKLFNAMISRSIAVPKLVFENDHKSQKHLGDIMQNIYDGYKAQL